MRALTEITLPLGKLKEIVEGCELNEYQSCRFYGYLAETLGYGGVRAVARGAGVSSDKVRRGLKLLTGEEMPPETGQRRRGGGRKSLISRTPHLEEALQHVLRQNAYSEEDCVLYGTALSLRRLAALLKDEGLSVSHTTLNALLTSRGYFWTTTRGVGSGSLAQKQSLEQYRQVLRRLEEHLTMGDPCLYVSDLHPALSLASLFPMDRLTVEKLKEGEFLCHGEVQAFAREGASSDISSVLGRYFLDWWTWLGNAYAGKTLYVLLGSLNGRGADTLESWALALTRFAATAGVDVEVSLLPYGCFRFKSLIKPFYIYRERSAADTLREGTSASDAAVEERGALVSRLSLIAREASDGRDEDAGQGKSALRQVPFTLVSLNDAVSTVLSESAVHLPAFNYTLRVMG